MRNLKQTKAFLMRLRVGKQTFFYLRMRDANEGKMKSRMKTVLGYQ